MKWSKRLKRLVAPGLRLFAGGRRARPDAGSRPTRVAVGPSPMRDLVALAWPIAAAMLGESAMGLVDTKLVGGLGPAALGGVGLGIVLMYLSYSLVFGLMRGVKVRTAYAVGEGRPEDGARYAQAGLLLGALVGAAVFVASRDVTPVLDLLGVDPSIVPYARDFLAARTSGAIAAAAMAALVQHRQGLGDSRAPMLVGLGGNVLNAVLAYGLVYGRFGMPALGVRGAGYGTALTETVEAAVLLALLARDRRGAPKPRLRLRQASREVLALGLPTGLHFGLETLAFTAFTTVIASLGAAQVAGHLIALNTIRASFLPGVAIAEAASVLVARSLGERRLDEADRVTRAAIVLGVGFMSSCGLVFALLGRAIASGFSDDVAVVEVARRLLLVAAVFQTLDAVNMILRGALRGAKDVRWVAVVGTTIVWSCLPGAAILLGRRAGWGAVGAWCGFVFETSIAAFVLWLRWSRGGWRRAHASSAELPAGVAV